MAIEKGCRTLGKRTLILGVQAFGVLLFSTGCYSTVEGGASAESAGKCVEPAEASRLADHVLQLVNLERAERNLPPVVVNDRLQNIAEQYACRMTEGKFFGHRDPESGDGPGERAIAGRYLHYAVGENLAADAESPAAVMKVWMASPSHRDIILDPTWREIGIAVRRDADDATYWVQEFGDPAEF